MIRHDQVVHHPLGGGSYYFKTNLTGYLSDQCNKDEIAFHIGAQPNCSPHLGNICTFTTGFALAHAMNEQFQRDVKVKFVYVDSAPAPNQSVTIDGVQYQKSLKHVGEFLTEQTPFVQVLDRLSDLSGVLYSIETQKYWHSHPAFPGVVRYVVTRREMLGPHISPETGKLGIRASCPHPGCGLTDKHGVKNQYRDDGRVTFFCPHHGKHYVNLASSQDLERLEFNTPLRNLIRILICSQDADTSWIMCTGSDYAGFYQEQLTWRILEHPENAPIIFYAPLVLDWSGAKLSKSMYVKEGAYKYLHDAGRTYMVDATTFLNAERGIEALYEEVKNWVKNPYMLFRNYSIEYLDMRLMARGMRLSKN